MKCFVKTIILVTAINIPQLQAYNLNEQFNPDSGIYSGYGISSITKLPNDKSKINHLIIHNSNKLFGIPCLEEMVNAQTIDLSGSDIYETAFNPTKGILEDTFLSKFRKLGTKNLQAVIFPKSITDLYSSCLAFSYSLKIIQAPEVKRLGDGCLMDCLSLTELKTPNVVCIGKDALRGCKSLKSLTISSRLTLSAVKNAVARATYHTLSGNFSVGTLDMYITPSAFYGIPSTCVVERSGKANTQLPEFLNEFGETAKSRNTYIEDWFNSWVSMYENPLVTISAASFILRDCINLRFLSLPKLLFAPYYLCSNNSSLKQVNIPSAFLIDSNAFRNCSSLEALILSNYFSEGNVNFNGSLRMNISAAHRPAIYPSAFIGIPLTCNIIRSNKPTIPLSTFFSELSIPIASKDEFVKEHQFSNYDKGTWIKEYYNDNLKTIERKGFSACTALEKLQAKNLKIIEDSAFEDCSNLSIFKANKIENIAPRAFSRCSSIRSLYLPHLKSLEWQALANCSSLERITIPYDVKTKNEAFKGCDSLNAITFIVPRNAPENVTIDLKELLLDTYLDESMKVYQQIKSIDAIISKGKTLTIKNAGQLGTFSLTPGNTDFDFQSRIDLDKRITAIPLMK